MKITLNVFTFLIRAALVTTGLPIFGQTYSGPYFGQKPPGMKPEIFAPGFISTDLHEFACSFSPDGKEFYFSRRDFEKNDVGIFFTNLTENGWTQPKEFINKPCFEPMMTPDGKRLYFSEMGVSENKLQMVIWYLEREGHEWSQPMTVPDFLSPDKAMYISVANSGYIYTTDISGGMTNSKLAVSKRIGNQNVELTPLGPFFNDGKNEMYPFISPDESYLLFCHPSAQMGDANVVYVTFNKGNRRWSDPMYIDLGMQAGTPYVSPDGRYLFFTSGERRKGDIYWVSSNVIHKLRYDK